MYSAYIITRSEAFESAKLQQNILDQVANLQASEWVDDAFQISSLYWLHRFLGAGRTPIAAEEFYPAFATWLSGLGATSAYDLVCRNTVTKRDVSCFDIIGPLGGVHNSDIVLKATRGVFYIPNLLVRRAAARAMIC